MDGHIYAEGFGEIGGALFRVDLAGTKNVKIAEESDLKSHVFAVGERGGLIFQKDAEIVERRPDGTVRPFRNSGKVAKGEPPLQQVIAYQWAADGTLYLSDAGNLRRVGGDGVVRFVAKVDGKLMEPKIWNSIDAPARVLLTCQLPGEVVPVFEVVPLGIYPLAMSHDPAHLVVIELRRGRRAERVVGRLAVYGITSESSKSPLVK